MIQFNKAELKQGEMLCTTTVRIEVSNNAGVRGSGTGFYYSIDQPGDNYIPLIITNKHVVHEMDTIAVVITEADKKGNRLNNYYTYQINNVGDGVVLHPDPQVDLCAITLLPLIADLQAAGKELYAFYINKNIIPNENDLRHLDAIEDVLMIGYPNGLWDEVNNMPLVRKGLTATHPNVDYNGVAEFLIDASCFGGSSGSPVFYLDRSYKTEIQPGIHGHKAFLLGVLYSGPQTYIEGYVDIPGHKIKTRTKTTLNLGHVIKSGQLQHLELAVLEKFRQV
ncbi:MAG TPA: serine protease [Mucilaginibacter sp.]|jgi:hypothetical protein|nr:serine protease [Mucilaginibacter sp.]